MNYANFYTSAQKKLIDSLLSIWFKGKACEQDYLRYILTEEEPLIAEPVFQSIFPWEESKETFSEHAEKLNILTSEFVEALSSEGIESDLRFPLHRHPYKHQTTSWETMLSKSGKTIVVTSGTGSGKTECFMIPVLQDIAQRNEKNCVQAIFLYPLNALMKSQQKRIHAWCNAIPHKITYAIYNGDTEKSEKGTNYTAKYYPELVTRPQIRRTPPQVLFTNPTMLNYMLVRAEDREILEKSKGKLKWILLDEAHTYTGSSAAELSLQLRRVLDAFGVTINDVNFAITSATIGDDNDHEAENKLKLFVSQLTGKKLDSIVVIGGKRIVPNMNPEVAEAATAAINNRLGTKLALHDIEKLRKKLNNSPVLSAKEIMKLLNLSNVKNISSALEIIDLLGERVEGLNIVNGSAGALLPTRAHFFIRSISGIYTCVNSECNHHKKRRLDIGSLTTYQNINCPACRSKMLEVATCPSCGGTIVNGETSSSKGFRMRPSINVVDLDNKLFYDNEDLIEEEQSNENGVLSTEVDGFTPFYFAKPKSVCLRHHTFEGDHIFNIERGKIELASENHSKSVIYKSLKHSDTNEDLCPHCGNKISRLDFLRASATQMGRILATLILDNAEPSNRNDADILYDGRKYITFTDNRQGSARSAMGINQDVEREWIRATIFHKLADIRLENIQPHELSSEDEQKYNFLKQMENEGTLPPIFKSDLDKLEERRNGTIVIPEATEVAWNDVNQALENNTEFRKLFRHLNNAREDSKFANSSMYLRALYVDQFGWIPKRANSLENMGLVRIVYPGLKAAKCPDILKRVGCKDEDWQNFLKISLDYVIRGGRHYMLSGEYKEYLTQNTYTTPIYPKDSDLRKNGNPVSKWVKVEHSPKGVKETQSRLILLLCAVLGYDDVVSFDNEKIANINSLLNDAWNYITSNILELVDTENRGYMLDLTGSKVKLQLIDTGFLCPVNNIIVDVNFCGYSPRINGYVGKDNFNRFKIKQEFKFPYFPFKTDSLNDTDVRGWIDNNFEEQKKCGIFSNIHEQIYLQKPIYIAAEHSAQQKREDLDRYEDDFNNGRLNILSCSTTMEMGVDIGGISEVVMNNVPPKSANYLQRAGRAGRRSETKALALTFCAPNPIGSHTWNYPKYPITLATETPLLKLESRQLIQRHVNALVFAGFVTSVGGFKVTSKLKDFFIPNDSVSLFDNFIEYIDSIIGGQNQQLNTTYHTLVKDTALENISINDAVITTKKDIASVMIIFDSRLSSIDKSLELIRNNSGVGNAMSAIEHQRNNFLNTSLLTYLAENSFLPSAGMPTGLVECMLGFKNDSNNPTMHLSQAVSAYAPGNQVVKNEWIYEPAGIRLKTKYDDNSSRYILQNCIKCGYTTINYGSAMNHCPQCGSQDSMHGVQGISLALENRFTEVVEPAAFTIAWGAKATRKMNSNNSMNLIQPVLLEMEPWPDKMSSAKMTVRCSTSRSEILFYNRGRRGYGYAFCPYCGKMESEKKDDTSEKIMSNHKHLTTGTKCPGGEQEGSRIRRHILLVGRYQTDFVEIKFYDIDNKLVTDSETLYSLGVILSRKLTELLGLNDGEIDFGYNGITHSIFIYDTALGGAGYSPLFREYKDVVLDMAYRTLKGCDCEKSCTKCLIDRQSQWYLNYLNRQKALLWLESERLARIVPEYISDIIPNASTVTSDFATELYHLCRNKDLKSLKVFIDNKYSDWSPSDFCHSKLLRELSFAGVDISFILNKCISVVDLSAPVCTLLLSTILQNDFQICKNTINGDLNPLLAVTFNDGSSKFYFGKNLNTSFSGVWGDGEIYSTMSDLNFAYSPVDKIKLLQEITEGDGSLMFDIRVKEECKINSILHVLQKEKPNKWNKIHDAMNGKLVSIEYSDRYLFTPLGCMILANLIHSIKADYSLNITSIIISVTKPSNATNCRTNATKVVEGFIDSESRNSFLSDAIFEMAGIRPSIIDNGYIQHERCFTIKSNDSELCIRPDAGISNGWKPFGREYGAYTDEDFRYDWKIPMELYNQKKKDSGILYTISYNKKL